MLLFFWFVIPHEPACSPICRFPAEIFIQDQISSDEKRTTRRTKEVFVRDLRHGEGEVVVGDGGCGLRLWWQVESHWCWTWIKWTADSPLCQRPTSLFSLLLWVIFPFSQNPSHMEWPFSFTTGRDWARATRGDCFHWSQLFCTGPLSSAL